MSVESKTELDPFRIVLGILSADDSDRLVRLMKTAGLQFDLALSEKDAYSHSTRIRAFLPRIQQAYDGLDEQTKLAVARAIIPELGRAYPRTFTHVIEALRRVGWEVHDGELVAAGPDLREMFFPKGSPWDAFVILRGLFAEAQTSLTVVDGYCDGTVFQMLAGRDLPGLRIDLLCSKHASALAAEAKAFVAQNPAVAVEVRETNNFHDRFLVVDDRSCVHIGASIKDAGKKAFMVSRVEDPQNRLALLKAIRDTWAASAPVSRAV